MADHFGGLLSEQIKSHPQFWDDLGSLEASAAWLLSVEGSSSATSMNHIQPAAVSRLMYSASVFTQASDERTRGIAQSIALCALITNPEENTAERSKAILAGMGNYPAVSYLESRFDYVPSTLLSELRVALLKELSSVDISGKQVALTDFQHDLWETLPNVTSAAISAPTSAGKSFLVIEYLCRRVERGQDFAAIFVAPTRALLSEVKNKIERRLQHAKDIRVSTVPAPDAQARRKQVFVLTQERLHVLLSVARLAVNLVIVDEAQGLADGPRGMILQDCLERLRAENPNIQTILLAPSAEGFGNVADLLDIPGLVVKETELSPVQQNRIQVSVREGKPKELHLSLLTNNGAVEIGTVQTERGLADRSTRLTAAALELGKTGAALVYATGPTDAEKVAAQFVADRPALASAQLSDLSKFIKEHIIPTTGWLQRCNTGLASIMVTCRGFFGRRSKKHFERGTYVTSCAQLLFSKASICPQGAFLSTLLLAVKVRHSRRPTSGILRGGRAG
jgi:hypothetical protein